MFELPASLLPLKDELEAEIEENKEFSDEWADSYFFTYMELLALQEQKKIFDEAEKLDL